METFDPPAGTLEQIAAQALSDRNAYLSAFSHGASDAFVRLAGRFATEMKAGPLETLSMFGSTSQDVRLAAISLIAGYWAPREEFARPCLAAAFGDIVAPVRGGALTAIWFQLRPFIIDSSGMLDAIIRTLRNAEIKQSTAVRAKSRIRALIERASQRSERLRSELAGSDLAQMSSGLEAAKRYLTTDDPNLRRAALLTLSHQHRSHADCREIAMKMVESDSDVLVRCQALDLASALSGRSGDVRMGAFFAMIVYGEHEPLELRQQAYAAIVSLHGLPSSECIKPFLKDFQFPEDVNWELVNRYHRKPYENEI